MISKSKTPKNTSEEKFDFIDRIKETPYFQWFLDNGAKLPYIFGGMILVIALIFKFSTSKNNQAESNYLLAENYFQLLTRYLQGESEGSKEVLVTLDKLAEITKSYPELNSRYDGLIAQLLLAMNKEKEAEPYAARTLQRTKKDNTPYHTAFSETTLLIAKGNYAEALDRAKELQKQLNTATETGKPNFQYNYLFAYNLLRIAMLEQQIGTSQGEKAAWEEWLANFHQTQDEGLEKAFLTLNQELTEGKFSLIDYINARTDSKNLVK